MLTAGPPPQPQPPSFQCSVPLPLPAQVGALTIRLMFNKDKNWTKALKHMLVDLKFVLKVGEGGGLRGVEGG